MYVIREPEPYFIHNLAIFEREKQIINSQVNFLVLFTTIVVD